MSDSGEMNKVTEVENSDEYIPSSSQVFHKAVSKVSRYKTTYPIVIIPAVITPVVLVLLTFGPDFERIVFGVIPAIVFGTLGHFIWWLVWHRRGVELEYHNKLALVFIGLIAGFLPGIVATTSIY